MIPDEGTGSSSTPIDDGVGVVGGVVVVVGGVIFIVSSQEEFEQQFGSDNPLTMSGLLVLVLSMVTNTCVFIDSFRFYW